MKKYLFRVLGIIASVLAPLAVTSVAHAASITWSGASTTHPADTTAKTITYSVNDTANWVGGVVPTAGDIMVFPANGAQVDPGGTLSDDGSWHYVIDNDLTAGTSLGGIQFTGDTGTSCYANGDLNDKYQLAGNDIVLTGNVTDARTGSCTLPNEMTLGITVSAPTTIEATLGTYSTSAQLTYGANQITLGKVGRDFTYYLDLSGTGKLVINGNAYYVQTGVVGSEVHAIDVMGGTLTLVGGNSVNTASLITVKDQGSLYINSLGSDQSIATNLIFEGSAKPVSGGGGFQGGGGGGGPAAAFTTTYGDIPAYTVEPRLGVNGSVMHGSGLDTYYTASKINLTGDLTFSSDLPIQITSDVTLSGAISGSGKSIVEQEMSPGILIVAGSSNDSATVNGTVANSPQRTVTYAGTFDQTYDVHASSGYHVILKDITLKKVVVDPRGKLGGIGTTGDLLVRTEGILAPGNSPGCINSGNLTLNGVFDVELQDIVACTKYDQMKVVGTVDLTGSTLNVIRYGGMVPRLNNKFVIIDNDGGDAVTGTFTGLAQGATTVVDGITYTVSYTGGDGNDVVLTVTAVDSSLGAPNTGFAQLLKSGVLLPVFAAVSGVSILAVQVVAKRRK